MAFEIDQEKYYRLKELGKLTGFSQFSLMRWCRENKLEYSRPGKDYIIKGEWFTKFIDKYKKKSK